MIINNYVLLNKGIVLLEKNPVLFGISTREYGSFRASDLFFKAKLEAIKLSTETEYYSFVKAEHSTITHRVKGNSNEMFDGDAITYRSEKGFLALVHCSHITLGKNILQESFSALPGFKNIHAVIYPGICQNCYEVQKDVYDKFVKESYKTNFRHFCKNGIDHWLLDLRGLINTQLLELGLNNENIISFDMCSAHSSLPEVDTEILTPRTTETSFFSYRKRKEMNRNLVFARLTSSKRLICANTGDCPYVLFYNYF